MFCDSYQCFSDRSLDGPVRSDDPEYISRAIREDYIVGSSCTIVLCGSETWKRKYVDWEICSTLHREHALLGVGLPTASRSLASLLYGSTSVVTPDRLNDNIESGYAHFIDWTTDPTAMRAAVEQAILRSSRKDLIRNSRPKMVHNRF